MRRAPSVRPHLRERRELLALAQNPGTPERIRLRARIVLRAAERARNQQIARELGTSPGTVARWRRRFLLHGTPGILKDAPRPGRPPSIPESKVGLIIRSALSPPTPQAPPWSTRTLAREVGVSKSTVQRIWNARGIGPHRVPPPSPSEGGMRFLANVTDMVGVFLNPPERAIALSTDERVRSTATGQGVVPALARLRSRSEEMEFRAFLQIIDRETPEPLDVHLLLDNRFAPVPPPLERWLTRHPRFHLHYLPSDRTGSTLIDRLVADFSRRKARPGESPSARRLRHAIRDHLRTRRGVPGPFVWTSSAEEIRLPDRQHLFR